MANVYAVKSGNWSDTTVWNTGALPTSADDVYSNTFTVTVDISATVLSIRNGSGTGITAGGGFQITSGAITLTANVINSTATVLTVNMNVGSVSSVIGSLSGSANNTYILSFNGSGTLNIIGNVESNNSGGGSGHGVGHNSSGVINITGNCTALGNQHAAVMNNSSGTVNITGNCTGNITQNFSTFAAVRNNSSGTINITGQCFNTAGGAASNSTGTLTVVGTCTASANGPAIMLGGVSQNTYLSGPFINTETGMMANIAYRWRWTSGVGPSYMAVPNFAANGYKNLYTSDSTLSQSGQPSASNVRSGTVYGPNSELTGTCAVPQASSVAVGVAVSNTTGTAVLTQQNVQDALSALSVVTLNQQTSSLTTPGSIGQRLALSSTVATVAQQLSDALSNE